MLPHEPVRGRDYLGVGLFTLTLYAFVLAVGGPLTLHEGVLSQTTKAMLADHDWLVPHYGAAPWLERPPLPQWIASAICVVIGRCDAEWQVRIGPALAGTLTVLLTLWLAGRLFGRAVGVLSALALATMYNFLRYSTLAEADIFLAPIVAGTLCAFARAENLWGEDVTEEAPGVWRMFFGTRPWPVLAFFVLLGMTNLVKGLVFGTVIAAAPIGVYLLWNAGQRRVLIFMGLFAWTIAAKTLGLGTLIGIAPAGLFLLWHIRCYQRYLWLWGGLAFAAVALPWPLLVLTQHPDALEVWKFDLFGRLNQNYLGEPPWYYFMCLTWVPQPWSIAMVIGMCVTWRAVWRDDSRAHRFIWCWAWMPILVFSLSQGKHHHYMLHYLAPWAILAAQGTIWLWQRIAETWQPRWAYPLGLAVAGGIAIAIFARRLPGEPWMLAALLVAFPLVVAGIWWFSLHRKPGVALVGSFAVLLIIYCGAFAYKGAYLHRSRADTAFLLEARQAVPRDRPLLINSADEALEGLRMQFYIGDSVYFLHNLSFVRDDRIADSDVYVVTRYNRLPQLQKYGDPEPILKCKHARRETSEADRWTLFRLHLRDNLERKNAAVRITPMQAMYREPGPDLDKR